VVLPAEKNSYKANKELGRLENTEIQPPILIK